MQLQENYAPDDDESDAETITPSSSNEERSEYYEELQELEEELECENRNEYGDYVSLDMLMTYLPKLDIKTDPVIGDWVLITPMRRSILLDPLIEWWERKPDALHNTQKSKKEQKRKRRKFAKQCVPIRWPLTMLLKSSLVSNMSVLQEEEESQNGEEENVKNIETSSLSGKHKLMQQSSNTSTAIRLQTTEEVVSMSSVKLAPLSVIRARYCKRERQKCNKESNNCRSTRNVITNSYNDTHKNTKSSRLLFLHTRTGLLTPSAPPCFGGGNLVETLIEMTEHKDNYDDKKKLTNSKKEKEISMPLNRSELVSIDASAQMKLSKKRARCDSHANVRYERAWISLTHDSVIRYFSSASVSLPSFTKAKEVAMDSITCKRHILPLWVKELEENAQSEWEEWQWRQRQAWEKSYSPRTIQTRYNNNRKKDNTNSSRSNACGDEQEDISHGKVNVSSAHGTPFIEANFPHST